MGDKKYLAIVISGGIYSFSDVVVEMNNDVLAPLQYPFRGSKFHRSMMQAQTLSLSMWGGKPDGLGWLLNLSGYMCS